MEPKYGDVISSRPASKWLSMVIVSHSPHPNAIAVMLAVPPGVASPHYRPGHIYTAHVGPTTWRPVWRPVSRP